MLKKKHPSYTVCREAGEGQNEHEELLPQQTTEDLQSILYFVHLYCSLFCLL